MRFSIIVPSYNQERFIEKTFSNLIELKKRAAQDCIEIELLLFDSCSNGTVARIIDQYRSIFDYIEIEKDKGQYDAINKGINFVTGDYWTWLNTDDLISVEGFLTIVDTLRKMPGIDYIYGNTLVIDEHGIEKRLVRSKVLSLAILTNQSTSVVQPGSFFRTEFTKKIGTLQPFDCCFDYEYILRLLKNKGALYYLDTVVSYFRFYSDSKSGARKKVFLREQYWASKKYGRKFFSSLTCQFWVEYVKLTVKQLGKSIGFGNRA